MFSWPDRTRQSSRGNNRAVVLRRWAFLLRPGWVILAVVVVVFAYLCFSVLAPWQLGKNSRTELRNHRIAQSVHAAPVALSGMNQQPLPEWQRVTVTGSYLPDTTVLVRLRHLDDAPAYSVLTAFRSSDGPIYLVDRGLVAAVDGVRPPPIAPPPNGTQELLARIRATEAADPVHPPTNQDGFRQVYSLNIAQITQVTQVPLTGIPTDATSGYLQLDSNQPGVFTPTPLPQLDAGPYLSYGLQWLAFGVMAPAGLGYFGWAEIRQRRRDRTEHPAEISETHPEKNSRNSLATDEKDPVSVADRLADRYGTQHPHR